MGHRSVNLYLCAKYGTLITKCTIEYATLLLAMSKDEQFIRWYICLFKAVNSRAPFLA